MSRTDAMIPTCADLATPPLVHRPADLFNPPALTNFLGCVQAAADPVALRNLNVPPLACGETASGQLFLDGRYATASGEAVTFRWFPDRVERRFAWRDLEVVSVTVMVPEAPAALVAFEVRNVSGTTRHTRCGLALAGSVARSVDGWRQAVPPSEGANDARPDAERGAVTFVAPSGAASVQGVVSLGARRAPEGGGETDAAWRRAPGEPDPFRAHGVDERGVWFDLDLEPGEAWAGAYVHALGDDVASAAGLYGRVAADPEGLIEQVRHAWDGELRAIFTPGNDRYSGSLPELETADPELLRLYVTGALGVVYFRRDSPHSAVGRAYDTLMPRYWQTVTYLWDYSLSGTVHALLDPAVMRGNLERWMSQDVHACYGTEWLTGGPVGIWYAVNDHAMTAMIDEHLRWSGDTAWLEAVPAQAQAQAQGASARTREGTDGSLPPTATVLDHLRDYATGWRSFATPSGLADYGGTGNLLECVSTYIHEVAALNAANAWNLRTLAAHVEGRDRAGVHALRGEADELVERLWSLYADGQGWFHARQPDGTLLPVRHCYDLLMVLGLIPGDVGARRRDEMLAFFRTQLQTPAWMRALSPEDPDAVTSLRPDHQWNGAYTAWPAYVAMGLYNVGADAVASAWVRGLARSANQGPFAQAHFVEDFLAPEDSGAIKASSEEPYINDWACSSGGAWARLVIESLFGVRASVGGVTASPRLDSLDPDARLVNLPHAGRLYDVDREGIRRAR